MPPRSRAPNEKEYDRDTVFARIAEEHGGLLYRVAYSLLRHAQDAEDAVQDTLLKLYRSESWRELEGAGEIRDERAFLARVVWRTALDRKAGHGRTAGSRETEEEGAELRLVDVRPGPERAAEEGDERGLLHALIEELPDELRQTLLLSAMDELSSREIGEVMGVPEGTVRTRLMRSRTVLKRRFEELVVVGREVAAGERSRR